MHYVQYIDGTLVNITCKTLPYSTENHSPIHLFKVIRYLLTDWKVFTNFPKQHSVRCHSFYKLGKRKVLECYLTIIYDSRGQWQIIRTKYHNFYLWKSSSLNLHYKYNRLKIIKNLFILRIVAFTYQFGILGGIIVY